MNREEKSSLVAELTENLRGADCAVIVNPIGQTVAQVTELRRRVRKSGAKLQVAKNTLVRRALDELGRQDVKQYLTGPSALAWSSSPVELAKSLVTFTKDYPDKLEVRGGWLLDKLLTASGLIELSKCPPLPEMRARTLGLFSAPAGSLVRLMAEVPASFVRVLQARADAGGN